ncbi:MAG: hypothetical protein ABSA01_09770 [Anaerolineales bacterium]
MLEKLDQKRPYFLKTLKHGIVPLFFYFISFGLLTYPLILKFSKYFFSDKQDGIQNIWNLWWVNLSVLRPDLHPTIWQTNMLHWPFGISLYAQTLNPFNGYLAVFLLRFLSLIATYNAIKIFAFVMAGLTMYWFSYYVTRSFWGSILAGFIFTFSGYHFLHAQGHLQLVSLEWIPLFILCWYILITRPHPVTAVAAAIVLWMLVLCDYYYFLYCVITAIFIFIWYAIISKNVRFILKKQYFVALTIFSVVALLLIGPIVGSLVVSNYRDPLVGIHSAATYSLDLFALIIPGQNWLFNQWTQAYWSKLPGGGTESSVYLGITVFILAGYVWIKRKTSEPGIRQQIYLWLVTMLFFFLMALGPALQIMGKNVWDKAMPYTLMLDVLPFMKLSGVPVRMVVMVIFGASFLSAIGFRDLIKNFARKRILAFVLLAVLLFETLPSPLPTLQIQVPGYVTALAGLPNDGGVLDLVTKDLALPLYYQTIHGKPITGGYVSRYPTTVVNKDEQLAKTIVSKNYGKLWATYHIRYIVTQGTIRAQVGQPYITIKAVYEQNGVRIYRIGCVCEGN